MGTVEMPSDREFRYPRRDSTSGIWLFIVVVAVCWLGLVGSWIRDSASEGKLEESLPYWVSMGLILLVILGTVCFCFYVSGVLRPANERICLNENGLFYYRWTGRLAAVIPFGASLKVRRGLMVQGFGPSWYFSSKEGKFHFDPRINDFETLWDLVGNRFELAFASEGDAKNAPYG